MPSFNTQGGITPGVTILTAAIDTGFTTVRRTKEVTDAHI